MLANVEKARHEYARVIARDLEDADKKQLRFNEIVEAAKDFYPMDVEGGIRELVLSCDRARAELYVPKAPMWKVLREQYGWMIGESEED